MIETALELDPRFAYAMIMLGYICITEALTQRTDCPQARLDRAIELATSALALDDSLGDAHSVLCQAFRYKGEHNRALEHGKQAVSLSPESADANMYYCGVLLSVGRGEEARDGSEKHGRSHG